MRDSHTPLPAPEADAASCGEGLSPRERRNAQRAVTPGAQEAETALAASAALGSGLGGSGGQSPLMTVDPRRGYADARLIERAVCRRWNVRPEHRERLPDILFGVAASENTPPHIRAMCARALIAAEGQNQKDELAEREADRPRAQHSHLHLHGQSLIEQLEARARARGEDPSAPDPPKDSVQGGEPTPPAGGSAP